MANHQSEIKRAIQNKKRNVRNTSVKTEIKTSIKTLKTNNDKNLAKENLKKAQSLIDKAAKKGVIHKKTAGRKISRLTVFSNKAVSQ